MKGSGFSIVDPGTGLSWPAKVILIAGCLTAGFALASTAVATVLVLIWLGKEVL